MKSCVVLIPLQIQSWVVDVRLLNFAEYFIDGVFILLAFYTFLVTFRIFFYYCTAVYVNAHLL